MDSLAVSTDYIFDQLTNVMITALEQEKITQDEASQMADYILKNIDSIKNQTQYLDLLTNLSTQWKLFESILTIEKGKVTEKQEDVKAEEVTNLIKENKLDEALKVAEAATTSGEEGIANASSSG